MTVTADSAVRVWELDRNNHWSFDRPTLAIDLKKLVDGTSSDEDFEPLGFGQRRGYSADAIEMEAASACFGGSGSEDEDAWSPMTLWVAMRPGDVYALCPLLPSKWQAPSTTIPSLSAEVVPKLSALEEEQEDAEEDVEEQLLFCRQQYEWLKQIDEQETFIPTNGFETIPGAEILVRPASPGAIPRLQGPFCFDSGDDVDDLDLCDLLVIPAKANMDELMLGEDDDESFAEENSKHRLSATVVCLSTTSGVVHVCLELDGVEGQWLPKLKKNTFTTPIEDCSELFLVESLSTVREDRQQSNSWPTFTRDVQSPYSFYVTNANNVAYISLSSWVQRLEAELQSEDTSGSAFRLRVLCEGSTSHREWLIQAEDTADNSTLSKHANSHLASSLVFYDYDVGYLLLTYSPSFPHAVILDSPEIPFPSFSGLGLQSSEAEAETQAQAQVQAPVPPGLFPPQRPSYQVPAIFYSVSPMEFFVDKHVPHRQRHTLREQVRLSPATLDIVTAAHRILSAHTNALERAASDLFRRCERLQGEMREQLRQLGDVAERIHGVSSEIGEDGKWKEGSRGSEALERRLQASRSRQEGLVQRYENLRNRVLRSGGRPLSRKEVAWMSEVDALASSLGESGRKGEGEDGNGDQTMSQRVDNVSCIGSETVKL